MITVSYVYYDVAGGPRQYAVVDVNGARAITLVLLRGGMIHEESVAEFNEFFADGPVIGAHRIYCHINPDGRKIWHNEGMGIEGVAAEHMEMIFPFILNQMAEAGFRFGVENNVAPIDANEGDGAPVDDDEDNDDVADMDVDGRDVAGADADMIDE